VKQYRLFLIILIFPFATSLGRNARLAISAADGALSHFRISPADQKFRDDTTVLESLHQPAKTPQPGEWRYDHLEPGQTFSQFALSEPTRLTAERNVIYVQPIGSFSDSQGRIVELSAEFLGLDYSCPVEVLPHIPEDVIPSEARRIHPHTNKLQFQSSWIHSVYLKPRLPDNAVVLLALTATDLWPGLDWNFVFGEASLQDRVGVWSIARLGNPDGGLDEFRTCLRRTLKIASHETGHMFSLQHCIHFDCNMSAGNDLEECDRYPLYFCPECAAKLHWSIRPNVASRYERLADFCERNSLQEESRYYARAALLMHQSETSSLRKASAN
jgi:archaemetzincin